MNITNYIFIFLSFLFISQGSILWKKQIVSLTFDFNNKNIKKEDVKPYTISFGKAYIILGITMFLMAISKKTYNGSYQDIGFVLFFMGFIISMIIIVKTQIKYKTGCFNI